MSTFPIGWGVPICWACGNQLVIKKGGGFVFRLVVDPIGHKHRVHKDCLERTLSPEVKECPESCLGCEEAKCETCDHELRNPAGPSDR